MTLSEIPSEAAEALMADVRKGCRDGGLAECYSCTREAIRKVLSLIDIHAHCVSLPNFPIDKPEQNYTVRFVSDGYWEINTKTTQTGTNAGGTV